MTSPAPSGGRAPRRTSHITDRLPLSRLPLLAGVEPRDILRLEHLLPVIPVLAGEEIPAILEKPGHLYVVRRGRLAFLARHGIGTTMMIAFGEPGDVYSTLGDVPAPLFIALEDIEVTPIPESALRALTQRYPQVGIDVAIALSERIVLLRDVVGSVGHVVLFERLWTRMLAMMGRLGVATPDGPTLRVPLTHAQWAMLIGGSRESVTLAMGRMRRDGYILQDERAITIPWEVWESARVERHIPVLRSTEDDR